MIKTAPTRIEGEPFNDYMKVIELLSGAICSPTKEEHGQHFEERMENYAQLVTDLIPIALSKK